MRRIMRTGIHTTRLGVVVTQIARRGFHTYTGYLVSGMRGIVEFGRKGVKIDIPVRTIIRAQTTANAPVFDDHFQRVAPPDGADGASHHAKRVAALAARCSHKILIEAQTFADQSAYTLMGIRAGSNALVTARALFEIEYQ
jgi:hypothetical protein